ncbi:MAG: (2Fe-2S)-binding protein [Steroidobacteraceae bacterium]
MSTRFVVNGAEREFVGDSEMPLLWYLRDHARLTGTKFGCGGGFCGACTVLVDGAVQRSCLLPVAAVEGRSITTIEGLAGPELHPVQRAWLEEDVPQCGYCQAGQILAAVALLRNNPHPDDKAIASITNLCRCGTYVRIRRAIARAASELSR